MKDPLENAASSMLDSEIHPILKRRAEQLAVADKIQEEKPSYAILKFSIANLEYGIETHYIREVISNVTGYTPIPGVPDYILGIKDIRGEIIPVVDILRILGIGHKDTDHADFCLVLKKDDMIFAMLADSIGNITKIEKDAVTTDAASLSANVARFCHGVASDGSLLLNGNLLFADTLINGIEG